ncbi:hypothetical protein HU200_021701 [Digitaria exilis]|uniref:Uncharacterized protein n=1 Tax=Digitaria exilis TaxID=1010633 RepID=A0A835EZL4_9POAL|nr:hypothetical protein HU200_021701 [Digitaria exilis]
MIVASVLSTTNASAAAIQSGAPHGSPASPLAGTTSGCRTPPPTTTAPRGRSSSASCWSSPRASNTFFLRLHRFHVARSGRVLGRSSDALEVIGDVDYVSTKDASSQVTGVTATPGTDGSSSLCLFCKEICFADLKRIVPPRPLQLDLNLTGGGSKKITVSPLPGLPPELGPGMPTRPISAAGDLWAPYLTIHYGPCRLVMLRLDKDVGQWVEVAAIDLPQEREMPNLLTGRVVNGYAVVGDGGRTTILLSLNPRMQPDHPFFAFDCSTHTLASVVTDHRCRPIHGRGVYVEEDDTIYSLGGSCICTHKLCQEEGEYRMAEPVKVDCVCPFNKDEGYGFLTHLGGRVMCAVWISVDMSCN